MNDNFNQAPDRQARRYRSLLEVAEVISLRRDLHELFRELAQRLPSVVHVNYVALSLYDPDRDLMRLHTLQTTVPAEIVGGLEAPIDGCPDGLVWKNQQSVLIPDLSKEVRWSRVIQLMREDGAGSCYFVPLTTAIRRLGAMGFTSMKTEAWDQEDLEFLEQVGRQVAVAVENVLAYQEINRLKDKLAQEKLYLEDEIHTEHNFTEVIGESKELKRVLKQVETVASTDSTVLIQGETGTGKELIARAIHSLSRRRERTFVKINCAAIPMGLLESELFGHERGAFTGAIAQRIGRFELAHQGTLFMDEVGDIPLELQAKLLRVLQEQEFERLGSTKTIKVNVRLVTATNRDLPRMISEKEFRSDLYYRLHVFPISLPPLRERREDIPLLVRFFVQKHSKRMNKQIEAISSETMEALTQYDWPGNIRELENMIERAVILSQGPTLFVPLAELKLSSGAGPNHRVSTLESAEREHILRILNEANWVIAGPSGAAGRLGMKRTTLQHKMKKLNISRPS
ncbi:MAG: sigma 54-interacting transcriptional regulator [Candidatus Manganitrophaceae bacterium]